MSFGITRFIWTTASNCHIIFSVNNFGSFRAPVSGVRVTAFGLTEETYKPDPRIRPGLAGIRRGELHISETEMSETFTLPENCPEGTPCCNYILPKSGIEYDIDLQFSDIHPPGYKWGDATYHLNDDFVGIVTHTLYANVTGRVVIDGNGGAVTGTGYMDQNPGKPRSVTRLVHSGYRMVHHGGPDNWDILYFLLRYLTVMNDTTLGHRLFAFRLGKTRINGVTQITAKNQKSGAFGKQLAQKLEYSTQRRQNHEHQPIPVDDETYSLLSELPWVCP